MTPVIKLYDRCHSKIMQHPTSTAVGTATREAARIKVEAEEAEKWAQKIRSEEAAEEAEVARQLELRESLRIQADNAAAAADAAAAAARVQELKDIADSAALARTGQSSRHVLRHLSSHLEEEENEEGEGDSSDGEASIFKSTESKRLVMNVAGIGGSTSVVSVDDSRRGGGTETATRRQSKEKEEKNEASNATGLNGDGDHPHRTTSSYAAEACVPSGTPDEEEVARTTEALYRMYALSTSNMKRPKQ